MTGWASGQADGPRVEWRTTMPRRQTMTTTPDTTQPAPGPDPIGEAAHAVWDALDLATVAAGRDPDAPHVLETADHPILVDESTWGILAVWGTTPVRITVGHARPEEAAALGMDGNTRQPAPPQRWDSERGYDTDLLCVATDDGAYQQPAPEPESFADHVLGGGNPADYAGEELRQQLVVEDGEDAETVARSLIGPKGKAVLVSVGYEVPGDQWPTAVYRGTRYELAAIAAKASGSPIGRPPGGAR